MRERRRATSEESEYDARSATPENELDEGDEKRRKGIKRIPFSLWDYLQEEVLAVEMEGEEGVKAERVTNFLTVPGEVEKVRCRFPCFRIVLTVTNRSYYLVS